MDVFKNSVNMILMHFLYFYSHVFPLAMLTGENYVDWKRNLDIVLTAENHKMVLTKPCPMDPIEESDPADKEAYASWKRSDEVARCYILASMSNVLQ